MTDRGFRGWRLFPALCALAGSTATWAAEPRGATPLGNPGEWVSIQDYPSDALRDESQGTVVFRLSIDTQGVVEHCEIIQSSGTAQLDTATCDLISRRARFSVATDAQGQAIKGTYTNRVRWVLPKELPQPRNRSLEGTYIVEKDGSITDCKLISIEGATPLEISRIETPCTRSLTTAPFLDDAGNPVRRLVRVRSSLHVEPVP